TSTLVSGPGLIYPNVNLNPVIKRFINGSQSGAMIYKSQPTGITMRKNIYYFAFFNFTKLCNDTSAVYSNLPATSCVFAGNMKGSIPRNLYFFIYQLVVANSDELPVHRPFKVNCRWPGRF